jgi:hypothetical protein
MEGWQMLLGVSPDRQLLAEWPGPYQTRRYANEDFSDKDWQSKEKTNHIEALKPPNASLR